MQIVQFLSHFAFTLTPSVHAVSEKAASLTLTMNLESLLCPQQFHETSATKALVLKALCIIQGLPVTDCMTSASTQILLFISTGFPQA